MDPGILSAKQAPQGGDGTSRAKGRPLEHRVPLLDIAGSKDFICPVTQAEPTMNLVSSQEKEFVVLDAGHVGLMAGPVAKDELWPRVRDWLEPRSG